MDAARFHVSDEDLLSAADGELSERRSARIRAHLGTCSACRARMAEIERTIGELEHLTREISGPELPSIDAARTRLRTRLAEQGQKSPLGFLRHLCNTLNYGGVSYVLVLMLLFVAGTRFRQTIKEREGGNQANAYAAAALPNPLLTPGATRPISLASICSSEHDQVERRVPEVVRQEIFQEYGIVGAAATDYEIDLLVTPGLGGSDDIRNLWPEPRYHTMWNSYVKDQLEDHLHHLVCNGQVNLTTAQQDIASDWISAYRKYFHTDAPLLPDSSLNSPAGPENAWRRLALVRDWRQEL